MNMKLFQLIAALIVAIGLAGQGLAASAPKCEYLNFVRGDREALALVQNRQFCYVKQGGDAKIYEVFDGKGRLRAETHNVISTGVTGSWPVKLAGTTVIIRFNTKLGDSIVFGPRDTQTIADF